MLASLTLIIGYFNCPCLFKAFNLITPVVVSSVPPLGNIPNLCACTVKSAPSSKVIKGLFSNTLLIHQ
mgnify:CR=1 FL=1